MQTTQVVCGNALSQAAQSFTAKPVVLEHILELDTVNNLGITVNIVHMDMMR